MSKNRIKFGPGQRKNPLPRSIDWKITLFTAIGSYLLVFLNTELSDFIPDTAMHVTAILINFCVGLLNTVKPYFGMSEQSTKRKVDIEDVDVMKDKE